MAQIDKIQVQSTTYDVAQSASANFTGTSNDTTNPTGWADVAALQNTETNASIFTKISKMFANIRWLYKQLGTTDYSATGASTVSSALANLQSGKAASSHSHGVADLPVTDQQNNSSSTIPTSALIYSMNQTLTSLNDAYPISNQSANCRYELKSLGTWSSVSQVNNFLAEYTHANDYRGESHSPLSIGNYVTIQDGTYNASWVIVGFDTELNRGASAAGYGISMIPYTYNDKMTSYMNSSNVTTGGYQGSYMHNTTLPAIASKLNNVLSTHMIERSILTSNAVTNGASSNWGWENQKLSLLSEVQVYGSVVWGSSGFDVGEACNKLPIFNYVNHVAFSRNSFWLRAVTSASSFANADGNGGAVCNGASNVLWVRPLLYIR